MDNAALSKVVSSSSPVVETQRELERVRRELLTSAYEIRDDVKAMTDWRRPIRRRPWAFVGCVFVAGLLLGVLSAPRRTRGVSRF